jgi:hypothetical protein
MLEEAYGKAAMKNIRVYGWYKRCRDGRASANDGQGCGRPSTSTNDENIERLRKIVRSDPRKSFQEISVEVVISVGNPYNKGKVVPVLN